MEQRAARDMSSLNISVTTPLQGFGDDEFSNILHKPSSIHLIPAGTALVDSPLGLGVRSSPHNDSVAYVRTGRCVIQTVATAHLNKIEKKPIEVGGFPFNLRAAHCSTEYVGLFPHI